MQQCGNSMEVLHIGLKSEGIPFVVSSALHFKVQSKCK